MKNILDYRLVVLNENGQVLEYPFSFGMHQTCLDDFAKKKGYEYSNEGYLVGNGNVIFKNAGSNILLVYLPENLSEEQLYQMDYIHNWLSQVEMLEACKYTKNGNEWYQCEKEVSDYFSEVIIQSYYSVKKHRS